jgi:hypothetical protein
MNEKAAVSALAALAQEARLRVFRALVGAALDGLTPGALSAMLDVPLRRCPSISRSWSMPTSSPWSATAATCSIARPWGA